MTEPAGDIWATGRKDLSPNSPRKSPVSGGLEFYISGRCNAACSIRFGIHGIDFFGRTRQGFDGL